MGVWTLIPMRSWLFQACISNLVSEADAQVALAFPQILASSNCYADLGPKQFSHTGRSRHPDLWELHAIHAVTAASKDHIGRRALEDRTNGRIRCCRHFKVDVSTLGFTW